MLERDVAEGDVGRVRRQVERLAVGDVAGAQTIDLAEATNGLEAPFKETRVEVARCDVPELTSERAGHPTDAAADLNKALLVEVGRTEAKNRQVRPHLSVTGGDKLLKCEVGALLVVEDPPGTPHDVVTARLPFRDQASGLPGNELGSTSHPGDCARTMNDSPPCSVAAPQSLADARPPPARDSSANRL